MSLLFFTLYKRRALPLIDTLEVDAKSHLARGSHVVG